MVHLGPNNIDLKNAPKILTGTTLGAKEPRNFRTYLNFSYKIRKRYIFREKHSISKLKKTKICLDEKENIQDWSSRLIFTGDQKNPIFSNFSKKKTVSIIF